MTRGNRVLLSLAATALVLGGAIGATALLDPWKRSDSLAPPLGTPFRLTSDEGRPILDTDLRGKPTAMFFGFTFCPEVCPTTLAELVGLMGELSPDAERLNVVFVSVDPERDTPEILHTYLSAFDDRIRGITGEPDPVRAMVKSYGIYFKRVPTEDGGYTMDHTAAILLLDAAGGFVGTIAYEEGHDTALTKLRRLDSRTVS
ncbi:SCO family protein [uncultured Aureimonas sp.]|uniref:SCO family protein n=1 Tax=uncultured Aureimonas sp. TaxID=1604662 RepID=UPI0025DE40C3|nr:SCO family protein [uncultured Aureimonas sp.]